MSNHNTYEKTEFVILHFVWAIIACLWYRVICFSCLEDHSETESIIIIIGIVVFCSLVGIILEMKNYRNAVSIIVNLLIGFGLYYVIANYSNERKFILISALILIVITAVYAAFIIIKSNTNKSQLRRAIFSRCIKVGIVCRNILCIGIVSIALIVGIKTTLRASSVEASAENAIQAGVKEQTFANNIDTLVLLQNETWVTLSIDEKIFVLQTVADVEQHYLGLPYELKVSAEYLKDNLEGCYSDPEHLIVVDLDCLLSDSSYDLTNTIAHEAYHSYQHRIIDAYEEADEEYKHLLLFHEASVYKEEFGDYKSGSDDYYEYYSQKCEEDARRYAEIAAKEYFERIESR